MDCAGAAFVERAPATGQGRGRPAAVHVMLPNSRTYQIPVIACLDCGSETVLRPGEVLSTTVCRARLLPSALPAGGALRNADLPECGGRRFRLVSEWPYPPAEDPAP